MRYWILLFRLVSLGICMSACGRNGYSGDAPEQVVDLYCDSWVMDGYMNALPDYDHVIYEQVYYDLGGRSVGPTEYRFRGIVYLTEEEAQSLWKDYEWEKTETPEFEFGKIDMDFIGEGPWYSCQSFEQENYKTVIVHYTVFDGEKLIFDISQM